MLREMPVTMTRLTVTVQVAVLPPSTEVTVMTVVPSATGVTTPLSLTVAAPGLEELHSRSLIRALPGLTVAVSWSVLPMYRVVSVWSSVTLSTWMFSRTLTTQVSVRLSFGDRATTLVVPTDRA